MTPSKLSPLPWRPSEILDVPESETIGRDVYAMSISDSDDLHVATVDIADDRKYIIHAANCYPYLMEALEKLHSVWDFSIEAEPGDHVSITDPTALNKAMCAALEALQMSRGDEYPDLQKKDDSK